MVLFLIFLGVLSVAFGGGCPPNSIGLQQNSSICYSFHPENLQYVAAEQACNSFGATLVTINDNYTNVYITQLSNVSFKKLGNEKFWANGHRLIGTKPVYPYIPPEVENNKADVTDGCMAVDLETGEEKFEDCFQRLPYVCEFFADAGKQVPDGQPDIQRIAANNNADFKTTTALDVPTTTTTLPMPETTSTTTLDPIITETIWEYFNATNSFYKGYGGGNWSFTEKWCVRQGGHLTSIHSKDEAVFVASLWHKQLKDNVRIQYPPFYTIVKELQKQHANSNVTRNQLITGVVFKKRKEYADKDERVLNVVNTFRIETVLDFLKNVNIAASVE